MLGAARKPRRISGLASKSRVANATAFWLVC